MQVGEAEWVAQDWRKGLIRWGGSNGVTARSRQTPFSSSGVREEWHYFNFYVKSNGAAEEIQIHMRKSALGMWSNLYRVLNLCLEL